MSFWKGCILYYKHTQREHHFKTFPSHVSFRDWNMFKAKNKIIISWNMHASDSFFTISVMRGIMWHLFNTSSLETFLGFWWTRSFLVSWVMLMGNWQSVDLLWNASTKEIKTFWHCRRWLKLNPKYPRIRELMLFWDNNINSNSYGEINTNQYTFRS